MAINKIIRTREKHHAWKGDKLGYMAAHSWLRKYHYDKKKNCEECGATERLQFAKRHESNYTREIADYRILCQSCHLKYDGQFFLPSWNKGHRPSPKLCEYCSNPFVPAKRTTRFCGNSCSAKQKAKEGKINKSHDPITGRWLALNPKKTI